MVIVAHPDDIEFSCAGTTARWVKAGAQISYVLLTSGDVGIDAPDISREMAIEIRETEARKAAEIAGVSEIIFLRQPDGMLEATLEMRKLLVKEIRRFKPEVVICGDPTVTLASETYINHPDHRAAAIAAIDAVFPAAGQPTLFEDIETEFGYPAHKPRKVYIQAWSGGTTFVNITDTIDIKIEALRAHVSQMKGWDPEPMLRQSAAEAAKGKEMDYAESYKVVTLVSDEDWAICEGDPIKLYYAQMEKMKNQAKESDSSA
ncbi:PIG-L family deacetylase [bacterium]|nr:PIG-L family deacetylase [bacterium]